MDAGSLFTRASDLCQETWPNTIFSSFHFFEKTVLYAGKPWDQIVAMSTDELQTNSEMLDMILQRIENADEEELRSLWVNSHGVCTSWAVLLASKIADDPNDLFFADAGDHRVALTRCGILIDSHTRVALQLKDGIPHKYEGVTYNWKGIGQDKPVFSYTVRLYSRTGKATLTRK